MRSVLSAAAIALLLASSTLPAQYRSSEEGHRWGIGLGAGPSFTNDDRSTDNVAANFQLFLSFSPSRALAVRVEGGGYYSDPDWQGAVLSVLWYATSGMTSPQPYLLAGWGLVGGIKTHSSDARSAFGGGVGVSIGRRTGEGTRAFLEVRLIQVRATEGAFNLVPVTIGVAFSGPFGLD